MSVDIKTFILEQIKAADPLIDRSPGSVFYDYLVNPLSLVLDDYRTEHETILANEAAKTADELTSDALDALGLNFLLERDAGTKSVGYVKFFYNTPKTLEFSKGTKIQTQDGLEYEVPTNVYVPRVQMENNIVNYPYYDSGPIPVISVVAGLSYNMPANTSFFLTDSTGIELPVKIVNSEPIAMGTDKESNEDFYERIKSSILNNSLASPRAIDTKIKENFTAVVRTEIIGAGHPLMIRDLIYTTEEGADYEEATFLHTYSGVHSGLYDKKSIAYYGVFNDTDETDEVALPSLASFSKEFSNDMYQGIYLLNDVNYAEAEQNIIIREYFGDVFGDVQPDLAMILASGNYQIHDGVNPSQSLFYIDEIRVEDSKLILGKYLDPDDPNNSNITVPIATIVGLGEMLNSTSPGAIDAALYELNSITSAENFNNLAPIFHKQIDQHLGIEISLVMNTTDNTEDGQVSYITVLRNSEVFLPQDGYGLAWRKQPGFLIRLNTGGTAYTQADVDTFIEQYGFDPVTAGLVGGGIKNDSTYWKHNVFLVDNDVLQEEAFIGYNQIIDQTGGQNAFLVAGKAWIEADIDYQFKIKIYETLGFEAWVFDKNNPPLDPYSTANRVLYRGATYPPYVPVSGEKVERTSGAVTLETTRSHFGIAVAQTKNCEWSVDDLIVRSFIETFPMHLFRFKINDLESSWDLTGAFNVLYYGVGYDPVQYALDGNTGHSKVKLAIWNVEESDWETVGTHTYTIDDPRVLQKIEKDYEDISDYIDDDMYVNLLALPLNTGSDYPDDVEHNLRSYYVEINNDVRAGSHRGNAADVYVFDPYNLQTGISVIMMTGNSFQINSSNFPGYIAEIVEIREYISKIAYEESSYSIINNDEGNSYSNAASYTVAFDEDDMTGSLVEVEYRYWVRGDLIDDLINSSEARYPTSSIKIKAMPLSIINIESLEYSGGLSETEMKSKIAEYFNTLTDTTFDKSDLVDLLYDNGANYVNLDMVVKIIRHDCLFNKETLLLEGQTYVIPQDTVSAFYTNSQYLAGVTLV